MIFSIHNQVLLNLTGTTNLLKHQKAKDRKGASA